MLRRICTFSLLALLIGSALFAATADARRRPSKPAKPTVRVVNKNIKIVIKEMEGTIGYFQESADTTVSCRYNERSIASGIINAPRYLVSQSFGPWVVGGYATGATGTAVMKLQVLCARNATVGGGRVPAKTVPGMGGGSVGGRPTGRATATGNCPRGTTAIGSPLSQEFGPGYGDFKSTPFGARGWRVVVNGVPEMLTAQNADAASADFTCVKAIKVQKKQLRKTLSSTGQAAGIVTCTGGRRALGWGVELGTYTSTYGVRDGAWATPMVQRAQFAGNNMLFKFATPPGANISNAAGTPVVAHVICGVING